MWKNHFVCHDLTHFLCENLITTQVLTHHNAGWWTVNSEIFARMAMRYLKKLLTELQTCTFCLNMHPSGIVNSWPPYNGCSYVSSIWLVIKFVYPHVMAGHRCIKLDCILMVRIKWTEKVNPDQEVMMSKPPGPSSGIKRLLCVIFIHFYVESQSVKVASPGVTIL